MAYQPYPSNRSLYLIPRIDTINDHTASRNMTQSESPRTPEDLPDFHLIEDSEGWSGGNERFRVRGNVIKIKQSDGDSTILPAEQQRRKTYDELGNYSQHVQQYKTDDLFQLWMHKIGPYLADWVLDKRNDPTALRIPWKLIGFPAGYTLWVHFTGDKADPANPRTDAYLYGSPHKIFRSPMEFVEHAIWLMKGGDSSAGECLCKYCTPGQNQRAINRRLNHSDADGEDDEGSGSEGGAAPTPSALNATRHPLFRNRPANPAAVASAAARRARRAARRERSPQMIMAKDYRRGNRGSGGSGSGGSGSGGGGVAT